MSEVINYAVKGLKMGKTVFIHCNQGESRAPSIGFLVLNELNLLCDTFEESMAKFKDLYPEYNPGRGIFEYTKGRFYAYKNQKL